MGIPIRWDNIQGPDFRTSANIMGQAQQSMNTALGGLGGIVQGMNTVEDQNWNAIKANNSNAFMRQLLGYRTPEEYQAAVQSGDLNRQLTGYGAQVDSDAALKAMDRRLVTLQQRDLSEMDYKNKVLDNTQAPIRDAIAYDTALGNTSGARAKIAANPNLRNIAPLAQAIDTRDWLGKERGQQQTNWGHTNTLAPLKQELMQANIDLLKARANDPDLLEGGGSGKGKGGKDGESSGIPITPEEAIEEAKKRILEADSKRGGGNINPFANLDSFHKAVGSFISKDEAPVVTSAGSKLLMRGHPIGGGKFIPYPEDVVSMAVAQAADSNGWDTWLGRDRSERQARSQLEDNLTALMKNPQVTSRLDTNGMLEVDNAANPLKALLAAKKAGYKPIIPKVLEGDDGETVSASSAAKDAARIKKLEEEYKKTYKIGN